jgi:Mrp family chromosome partitioning ATPase
MVYFHESLPLALKIAAEHSLPLDKDTLVIRDATGRLAFAREQIENSGALSKALSERLGAYAAGVPVVTGAIAARLIMDAAVRIVETESDNGFVTISHIDRRLVGADWLLDPGRPLQEQPRRLVFTSLKGGVGRSTALTVLAADLARRGLSVLAVDLDIEAPGIGFMLLPQHDSDFSLDRRPRFGVVDFLVEDGLTSVPDEGLVDFISPSPFGNNSIDVIPAVGRETDSHPHLLIPKLSRALVEDIINGEVVPVWRQVESMLKRFEQRRTYDVVLIDARAGLAEISAAPLLGLGAHVLLFGTNQPHTFRGYRYLLSYLAASTNFADLTDKTDWRQHLSFVQAKAPLTTTRRLPFRQDVYDLCAEFLYEESELGFSFGPEETGPSVPHDALHIIASENYGDFDPLLDPEKLDPEAYRLVFGSFLDRIDQVLQLTKTASP